MNAIYLTPRQYAKFKRLLTIAKPLSPSMVRAAESLRRDGFDFGDRVQK